MGNIMDYISWRGDLTFEQSKFNEVDNLILACFSYVNLDGIPAVAEQKGIELKNLTEEFMKLHTMEELEADKSFIRLAPFMMLEMAETNRFGNSVIRNYVNEIVTEAEQQFAAVEIVLEDGTSYVSFRGTDDTIIGWKEDFNLSTGVVPAQERAVEYVRRVSENTSGMLRVGGHSKGGNLAIYGAVMCKEAHEKIMEVYSNDGPGFSKEFSEGGIDREQRLGSDQKPGLERFQSPHHCRCAGYFYRRLSDLQAADADQRDPGQRRFEGTGHADRSQLDQRPSGPDRSELGLTERGGQRRGGAGDPVPAGAAQGAGADRPGSHPRAGHGQRKRPDRLRDHPLYAEPEPPPGGRADRDRAAHRPEGRSGDRHDPQFRNFLRTAGKYFRAQHAPA